MTTEELVDGERSCREARADAWAREAALPERTHQGGTKVRERLGDPVSPVKVVERVPDGIRTTPTEAAEELGLTLGRVLQLCEAGSIVGAEKVGHRWRIPYPIKRIPRRSGRRVNSPS